MLSKIWGPAQHIGRRPTLPLGSGATPEGLSNHALNARGNRRAGHVEYRLLGPRINRCSSRYLLPEFANVAMGATKTDHEGLTLPTAFRLGLLTTMAIKCRMLF